MPTILPTQPLVFEATGFATGLAGTGIWVRVIDANDTEIVARTTAHITERLTGSGTYRASIAAPDGGWDVSTYTAFFDDGGTPYPDIENETTVVARLAAAPPATEGSYTSVAALRAELDVDDTTLPDDRALTLISDAEDWVDNALGAWPFDETTGRKIDEDDVLPWQFEKLSRATCKAAAALYARPALLTARSYRKESGPDFTVEDPQGGGPLAPAVTLLNASGLRRLTGRAVAGRRPVSRDRHFQYGDCD